MPSKKQRRSAQEFKGLNPDDYDHIAQLVNEANKASLEASAGDISLPLTATYITDVSDAYGIAPAGILGQLMSITSFFLTNAKVELQGGRFTQPAILWCINIAYPGMKKTPVLRYFMKNLDFQASKYKRNLEPRPWKEVVWGSGTTEAMVSNLCNKATTAGCAMIVSNEFNSFISDMNKYQGGGGADKNFYCDLYDGLGIKRSTKSEGSIVVEKTNVVVTGMIQPEFIVDKLKSGADPEGLYRRFLLICPSIQFKEFGEYRQLSEEGMRLPSKIWEVIYNDEVIGRDDVIFTLTDSAKAEYVGYFNGVSHQCNILMDANKAYLVTNLSKSRDQILRIATLLHVIECALEFLDKHPKFNSANIDSYRQPLMPGANLIGREAVEAAVKNINLFQKQRDILSEDLKFREDLNNTLNAGLDKFVLLFDGKIVTPSALTKKKNPYIGRKATTAEYISSMKRLGSKKLGVLEEKNGRNGVKTIFFIKKTYEMIARDVDAADAFPKDVLVREYEEARLKDNDTSDLVDE